ncbi:VOC family protein [Rhodococcus sp. G-MC3]|uniref:VOC family protein n=1 Tax=Rhodococcus sp. G-MC3 TaxID=3046209 RepID=UPI0024B8E284|nr:VOC family protein [Rhodococcus sp. G-MC3]MDJ0395666.1 VOC family protein [Rhodococcus sp. G-MC3]
MTDFGRLLAVTIDCPEPRLLAEFYQGLLGGDLRSTNPDFVVLTSGHGGRLDFQRVDNPKPLPWPSEDAASRLHLDFIVDDLDEGEQRLLELGAVRAEFQPGEGRFRVFVDLAGHPFCIVTQPA